VIDESLECKRCQNITDVKRIRLFIVNYTETPSGKVIGQRASKLYCQGAFEVLTKRYGLIDPIIYKLVDSRECFR